MNSTTQRAFPPAVRAGLLLSLGLLLVAAVASATPVTFKYQPVIGGVKSVSVAGDFNGWSTSANPLADKSKNGIWEATLDLPPGRIMYKFVVDGGTWITDETAAEFSPDGFGGQNAVLVIKDKPVTVGFGTAVKKPEAPKLGLHSVGFKYKPETKAQSVCVAGTFNDWTVGKTPMVEDAGGTWSAKVLLPVGSYMYKFVVNGGQWVQDKAGQDGEKDDGYGGKNSTLEVDDRFAGIEVKRGDGKIFADGIQHTQGSNEVNNLGGGTVEFTARAHRDDVDGVSLEVFAAGAPSVTPMQLVNRDKAYEYYRATVKLPAAADYVFKYVDGGKAQYLTSAGLEPGDAQHRFHWDAAAIPAFITPDWVKNGIIYQIYPDRFRNGNPANDQDFKEWYYKGKSGAQPTGKINPDFQEYYHLVKDWNDAKALSQCPWTPDGRDWMAFYGGDIEGVRQELDYLKGMGVTVIYFNPIFEAKSTHKYDGADYTKVDPHFATNAEFKAFVKEARQKGIRIILDIVYNHTGNAHWAFKAAADSGSKSAFYNWYEWKQNPLPQGWPNVDHTWKPADYYSCWWGFGDLPQLNFDLAHTRPQEGAIKDIKDAQPNWPLVNHLLDATEFWLKDMDVDGVRLDVPNEVPAWFWKLFNERVKKTKPDAYIVGELWGNATDWVKPGVFDAVMNYAFFRDPVARFLGMGQGTAQEFDGSLAQGRLAYPSQAVQVQMNLIDSHDTVRFLTQVNGDVSRLKLAALFSMTYVGAPTIYYGDEIGMLGGKDPDCRRPMIWDWKADPQRASIHDWYAALGQLRGAHAALRTGSFRTVYASGMGYAYERSGDGEDFLVVINAGHDPLDVPVELSEWGGAVHATDALAGGAAESWSSVARLSVPGGTGRVFRLSK